MNSAFTPPTITALNVTVLEETGEFILSASGKAAASSQVSFYLNDRLVGATTTKSDGTYSTDLPLNATGKFRLVAEVRDDMSQQSAASTPRDFSVGSADDTGAKDWGHFFVASNDETFTTLNGHKSWSISAPDNDTLRFELRDNDVAVWDLANKAATERSEARLVDEFSNGVPLEISYKFNLAEGAKNDSPWLVLGQLHQNDVAGAPPWSPPVEFGLLGERMVVYARYTGADGKAVTQRLFLDTADIDRGHDYDMKIQAVFDPEGNGRLVVTRDGATIVDYSGKLNYAGHDGVYWQEGIYRHVNAKATLVAEYKDLTVTTGGTVPPAEDGDDSALPLIHLLENVGSTGVTLQAVPSSLETKLSNAPSFDSLRWQTSSDGQHWNDAVARGSVFDSASALSGQFVRAVAPSTGTVASSFTVSSEVLLFGGTGHDTLLGLEGGDVIAGLAGNDTIDGRGGDDRLHGGSGDDRLVGGAGDDRLSGDDGHDMLDGGTGNDMLYGGSGSDKLVGGAGDDGLFGGDGDDTLYGFDGDDTLDGDGGNDFLHGGAGSDLLRGGQGNDRLEGLAGNDTLKGGSGDDFLLGGDGRDHLFGGEGNDWLDGGTGADRLEGGTGDDRYIVDDPADIVVEIDNALGGGKDSVSTTVSFTLPDFVETLNLTGKGNIAGAGNALANRIVGNDGDNVIAGMGGMDIINGGGGADTFVFLNAEKGSQDRILDFSSSQGDKVAVDDAFFGLTAGTALSAALFVSGAGITQGTAELGQFLFDTTSRVLSWDADGSGAGQAVALAGFDRTILTAEDFLIV